MPTPPTSRHAALASTLPAAPAAAGLASRGQEVATDPLLFATFLDLVQIPSPSRAEARVAAYVRAFCAARAVVVREDDAAAKVGGESGNLIVDLPATDPARGGEIVTMFLAHMDTVTPAEPVRIIRENGLIRTDGAAVLGADAKSGVAVMLAVLDELVRTRPSHGPLRFVFSVNEESGPSGAEFLDDDTLAHAIGLVLDSSGDTGTLVAETPTARFFDLTFHGRAAHAGLAPEKGVNAIAMAAAALAALPQGRLDANTLVNIGAIRGGERRNVVPPLVTCEGEVRCFAPARCEDVIARVRAVCEDAAARFGGRAEVVDRPAFTGYSLTPDDVPVARVRAAMRGLGVEAVLTRHGGGSDANELVRRGVPAVNIGMGYTANHSTAESIPEAKLRWVYDLAHALATQASHWPPER